eukprot:Rhum_TRINITY_DN14824_c17_g1::Rhum_TRINITY_DN14824_c17_g1_i1::g.119503::m.119503
MVVVPHVLVVLPRHVKPHPVQHVLTEVVLDVVWHRVHVLVLVDERVGKLHPMFLGFHILIRQHLVSELFQLQMHLREQPGLRLAVFQQPPLPAQRRRHALLLHVRQRLRKRRVEVDRRLLARHVCEGVRDDGNQEVKQQEERQHLVRPEVHSRHLLVLLPQRRVVEVAQKLPQQRRERRVQRAELEDAATEQRVPRDGEPEHHPHEQHEHAEDTLLARGERAGQDVQPVVEADELQDLQEGEHGVDAVRPHLHHVRVEDVIEVDGVGRGGRRHQRRVLLACRERPPPDAVLEDDDEGDEVGKLHDVPRVEDVLQHAARRLPLQVPVAGELEHVVEDKAEEKHVVNRLADQVLRPHLEVLHNTLRKPRATRRHFHEELVRREHVDEGRVRHILQRDEARRLVVHKAVVNDRCSHVPSVVRRRRERDVDDEASCGPQAVVHLPHGACAADDTAVKVFEPAFCEPTVGPGLRNARLVLKIPRLVEGACGIRVPVARLWLGARKGLFAGLSRRPSAVALLVERQRCVVLRQEQIVGEKPFVHRARIRPYTVCSEPQRTDEVLASRSRRFSFQLALACAYAGKEVGQQDTHRPVVEVVRVRNVGETLCHLQHPDGRVALFLGARYLASRVVPRPAVRHGAPGLAKDLLAFNDVDSGLCDEVGLLNFTVHQEEEDEHDEEGYVDDAVEHQLAALHLKVQLVDHVVDRQRLVVEDSFAWVHLRQRLLL